MAYIEAHQSLRDHRKILALAAELDMLEAHVAGHALYLWLWSLDNAPKGILPASDRIIERAAGWAGEPGRFVTAMVEVGMLDRDEEGRLSIHDWYDYAGRLIEKRESDAERKRLARTSSAVPVTPHVTSVARPTDNRRTTDGQPTAGAGTVPNLTVTNHHVNSGERNISKGKRGESAALADVTDVTDAPVITFVGAADAAADVASPDDVPESTTPTSKPKVVYGRDAPAFQLAQRLTDAIRRHKPDARLPNNLQRWCAPMELAMRIDGRTFEQLAALIDWLPTNEFWRMNVLSAGTFREKLPRLEMQRDSDQRRARASPTPAPEGVKISALPRSSVNWDKVRAEAEAQAAAAGH